MKAARFIGGTLACSFFLPELDSQVFNEILCTSHSGPRDEFAEREPWIEIMNQKNFRIGISGWYLMPPCGRRSLNMVIQTGTSPCLRKKPELCGYWI